VDEAVDHLYAVPLEEFVKERTRLSRELRKQDRSAAAELAKLPKPSAAAWALNHIAREDPEAMGDWLATADALREASNRAAELGGDTVRGAMAAHRKSTQQLTEVVREQARPGGKALSEAMLGRVRSLLQAATADEEMAERLRAGRITEEGPEDEAAGEEEEIVWTAAPRTKPPRGTAKTKAEPEKDEDVPAKPRRRKAEPEEDEADRPRPRRRKAAEPAESEEDARAARLAELERLEQETEAEVEHLRRAAERADATATAAEARAEEARKALHRSESEAEAARAEAGDVRDAAEAAERDLQQVRQRLRKARD
jgi:hypothetical protein